MKAKEVLNEILKSSEPQDLRRDMRALMDEFFLNCDEEIRPDYKENLYFFHQIIDKFLINLQQYQKQHPAFPA